MAQILGDTARTRSREGSTGSEFPSWVLLLLPSGYCSSAGLKVLGSGPFNFPVVTCTLIASLSASFVLTDHLGLL